MGACESSGASGCLGVLWCLRIPKGHGVPWGAMGCRELSGDALVPMVVPGNPARPRVAWGHLEAPVGATERPGVTWCRCHPQAGARGDGGECEHARGHPQRAGSLRRPGAAQVAVRRLVQRCHPRQPHGSGRQSRVSQDGGLGWGPGWGAPGREGSAPSSPGPQAHPHHLGNAAVPERGLRGGAGPRG